MSILTTLTDQMKAAMKAHDQARLDAVRMLISAIKYAMVDSPDMDEPAVVAVLTKEAKKRREAVEAYKAAGRVESAEKEAFELSLIEEFLPKMMSEDDVRAKLQAMSAELAGKNIGDAMKMAMGALKGQADGGTISKIVKEILAK